MIAVLNRLKGSDAFQTLGHFVLYDGTEVLMQCKALELPDRNNARGISRIPPGVYDVEERWSKKYNWHFHVLDVEGRSWILIHHGNYYTQTEGCILVGKDFVDINGDGHLDVTDSRNTLINLQAKGREGFQLLVNDLDKI